MPIRNAPVLDAVKVSGPLPKHRADVTYTVLSLGTGAARDKRAERRWRTHLRSGKIVDGQSFVVAESQIRDRSTGGMRLRLAADIALPERIRFFDENGKRMFDAAVAWQRGREIGLSLLGEIDASRLTRAELFRLGIKPPRAAG